MTSWIPLLSEFDVLDFRRAELAKKREASTEGRKALELDKKLEDLAAELEGAPPRRSGSRTSGPGSPARPGSGGHRRGGGGRREQRESKPSIFDKIKKPESRKAGG